MTDNIITEPYALAAVLYRQAGWLAPIPVVGKHPPIAGYTGEHGAWPDDRKIAEWINDKPTDNIGLRLVETIIGIDVDAYDGRNGARTIADFEREYGDLPPTWRSTSRDDGESGILFFRVPAGVSWVSNLGRESHVDIIRMNHRYAVVWPSIHPITSRCYMWYPPASGEPDLEPPDINLLATLPDAWVDALSKGGSRSRGSFDGDSSRGSGDHSAEEVETMDVDGRPVDVGELLRSGIPVGEQNEVLYRYLSSMRARGFKREEMMLLGGHVLNMSQTGDHRDPWTEHDLLDLVNRVRREYSPGMQANGLTPELRGFVNAMRRGELTVDESPPREENATDLGNTIRFTRLMRDRVRYAADENQWYIWDDIRWAPDRTNKILDLTIDIIDDIRLGAFGLDEDERRMWARWAHDSEALGRRRAIIEGAKADPDLVVTAERFDTNPWLLVCRNGTVDLRTGLLRPSDPNDLCTHRAEVDFDPVAECPRWRDHVKFVSCGRVDMARYLRATAGYSLTGHTGERAFFFLIGTGTNGKNVFIEPIMQLMGSYAKTASSSLLTGGDEQHPTILADLHGSRLVFIDEVRQNQRLNVERLKSLTGSKRIKARRMREDFFEFDAQFKLWIAANGHPRMKDPSDGVWTRMKEIEFKGKVAPAEIIKDYGDMLYRDEASGILNWLLHGVQDWRDNGLPTPVAVTEAVSEYRRSEDYIEQWLEENPIIPNANGYLIVADVYQRFNVWQRIDMGLIGNDLSNANQLGMYLHDKLGTDSRVVKRANINSGKSTRVYLGYAFED